MGHSSTSSKIARIAVVIVSVLTIAAIGTVIAFRHYRMQLLKGKLEEAIGRDRGLTETILKVETDSPHITFGEFFKICDQSVDDRTKLIVELRGLYPEVNYQLKSDLIEFFNQENELVRTKRNYGQKAMDLNATMTLYVEKAGENPRSEFGLELQYDSLNKLSREIRDTADGIEKDTNDFRTSFDRVATREAAIAIEAQAAGIRFQQIFTKYADENQRGAKAVQVNAMEIRQMSDERTTAVGLVVQYLHK